MWTEQQLIEIDRTDELQIAPRRADGSLASPRIVWGVRVGDDVYIRSVRGESGGWYRTTRASHEGHVTAGDVDADVAGHVAADAPVQPEWQIAVWQPGDLSLSTALARSPYQTWPVIDQGPY